MRVCRLKIENFRGVQEATLLLPAHAVLIGDNNTGKTTILEAIDLALGPDRLNRNPPIDEHDFYLGRYAPAAEADAAEADQPPPQITIEATVTDLSEEQKARFGDHIEFWDTTSSTFYDEANPAGADGAAIAEAIRVTFVGTYDAEQDDFEGRTFFSRTLEEAETPTAFTKRDKQTCGFLYLRSLRTGSRALSLERGSLLDVILRLKEVRPKMWEDTIGTLADYTVASDPELGVSGILESISNALKKYVPKEWGIEPHLKVSNLTREHLRSVITAFIGTGDGSHAAPFYRQGTGTINMLVLAMLTQIAADKHNVVFAMEEPETAIPPYAQKRIVHEIRKLAAQTIFTSHSPYVLEEFSQEETVVLTRGNDGKLEQRSVQLPESVKAKRYRQEFRTRFCEGLLARRVLIAEGATEAAAFPVVCRRLAELDPDTYVSLEALGVCTVDAGGENNIADMAKLYRDLGKRAFAICDSQDAANKAAIEAQADMLLMHDEKGFEHLVLKNTTQGALQRFAALLQWPPHLAAKFPDMHAQAGEALEEYFLGSKANWGIADFLAQCDAAEIPAWLREASILVKGACEPEAAAVAAAAEAVEWTV